MGPGPRDNLGAPSLLVLGEGKPPSPLTWIRKERPQECNNSLNFWYIQLHLLFTHKVDNGLTGTLQYLSVPIST